MRDFTRQERAALDRHLTTDPRDTEQSDLGALRSALVHFVCVCRNTPVLGAYLRLFNRASGIEEPDPCPRCQWVGCHEEGCPNRQFTVDELVRMSKADLVARVRARGEIVSPIEKWSRDELIEELRR